MNESEKAPIIYVPGVCNIGPEEIALRKRIGRISLFVTVLLWVVFVYFNLARGWFLLLFFPASMSATGFIQGFGHFCAGFGMKGVINFGSQTGKTEAVAGTEDKAKDKKKALRIFGYSVLIGLIVAIAAFFLN